MRPPLSAIEPLHRRRLDRDARAMDASTASRVSCCPAAGAEIWPGACGRSAALAAVPACPAARRARRSGSGDRARCSRRRRLRLLLALLRFLLLLLHLRHADEILPADQHQCGQGNGEDGVFLIVHRVLLMAMRAANGAIEILLDAFERQGQSGAAPDQHIVMSGANALRAGAAGRFPASGGAHDCVPPRCRLSWRR